MATMPSRSTSSSRSCTHLLHRPPIGQADAEERVDGERDLVLGPEFARGRKAFANVVSAAVRIAAIAPSA